VIAAVIRFAADPWLANSVPYLLFYPAIVVAATYGGFWPGVLATSLSGVIALVDPIAVEGDPGRLGQLVWNVLSNAVKFTPAGGHVTVAVTAVDGHAELHVADTGMGIPQGFLPYVFDNSARPTDPTRASTVALVSGSLSRVT
jgi:signal transduction histidine kinase